MSIVTKADREAASELWIVRERIAASSLPESEIAGIIAAYMKSERDAAKAMREAARVFRKNVVVDVRDCCGLEVGKKCMACDLAIGSIFAFDEAIAVFAATGADA